MQKLLNRLFPTSCVVCGQGRDPVCSGCKPVFAPSHFVRGEQQLTALTEFEGSFKNLLEGYKDKNLVSLKPPLVELLRLQLARAETPSFDLVMVPPRNSKNYRKRGFDPAFEVARGGFGRNFVRSFRATRKLQDQRTLNAKRRIENVAMSFYAGDLSGRRVLLFDDVCTTGATMLEMARASRASGAQVVASWVLAQRN